MHKEMKELPVTKNSLNIYYDNDSLHRMRFHRISFESENNK